MVAVALTGAALAGRGPRPHPRSDGGAPGVGGGAPYAGEAMAYLDHAATTPMLPEAAERWRRRCVDSGNPSSLHAAGRRARRLVEESRERIAAAIGARPYEVVFTGGGTESDNLAVKGIFWARRAADPRRRRVLASAVEHHAVLDAVEWLAAARGRRGDLAAGGPARPGAPGHAGAPRWPRPATRSRWSP